MPFAARTLDYQHNQKRLHELDVRYGSLPVAQYTLCEGMVPGVKQPLDDPKFKLADLSVCFHQYQPFARYHLSVCFRPKADAYLQPVDVPNRRGVRLTELPSELCYDLRCGVALDQTLVKYALLSASHIVRQSHH